MTGKSCSSCLGLGFALLVFHAASYGSCSNVGAQRLTTPVYWGPWSGWSPCSSQCGEGVETRTRLCLQWTTGRDVARGLPSQCQGYAKKKRLCYGKCEDGPTPPSTDECSGLNYNDYNGVSGVSREWVQIKRGFPCEIACLSNFNRGTRTIRVKENGTPCQTYGVSNGECFAGLCKSVDDGCRDSYGRPLQIDMCMECGGTNSTCQRKEGHFRTMLINNGLNDMPVVVRIPEGSTSIQIVKYGRARNTLALMDSSNRFVINEKRWPSKQGNYKIDGIRWVYMQGVNQESMTSQGPTVANITVRLTSRLDRQVVHYSLWLPKGKSLGSENNYFYGNPYHNNFQLENGLQTSNEGHFVEPFLLRATPQPSGNKEFDEPKRSNPISRPTNFNDHDRFKNERENPAQIQIESHPSQTRHVNEPVKTGKESGSAFSIDGAKTLVDELENGPYLTLDTSYQPGNERQQTDLIIPSSDTQTPSSEGDGDVWKFVETELKNRGEDYIWQLVESQLHALWEEAVWELVEEELRSLGEEDIWELVEEGLRRLHKPIPNKTSQNADDVLLEAIHPKLGLGHNSNIGLHDAVIHSGKGKDRTISGGGDIILTKTEEEEISESGGQRAKDNRTRRVNVTFRELTPKGDRPSRVRPREKIRKWKKLKSKRRPKPKRIREKKGKWRPNDIYRYLKPNEHCFPCIRPKDKVRQFCTSDFVSKVHVKGRKVIGDETRYDVTILSSYRNRVRLLQREYIWMESTCRCPRVKTKRTYIVMGKMQSLSGRQTRLVITPKSYIRGFSVGFDRKIRELTREIQCPGS